MRSDQAFAFSLFFGNQVLMTYFQDRLQQVAEQHGQRLLRTPNNPISMAITLDNIADPSKSVGASLFLRGVSGTR